MQARSKQSRDAATVCGGSALTPEREAQPDRWFASHAADDSVAQDPAVRLATEAERLDAAGPGGGSPWVAPLSPVIIDNLLPAHPESGPPISIAPPYKVTGGVFPGARTAPPRAAVG